MFSACRRLVAVAAGLLAAGWVAAAEPPAAAAASAAAAKGPFAVVGTTVITGQEFQTRLAVAMRNKYYHAKPPEGEYAKFQREVGEDLVNRVLLLAEARKRGIQPDREKINATVAGYDAQYKDAASWKTNREKMLAQVVPQLENESLLDRLGKAVRDVPMPTDAVARAFYEKNKELFVEPEQVKISVILLKVEPSSKQAVWDSAMAEAKALHKRLQGGASFEEAAKLHSGDISAMRGGQMEYIHRGMLPEAVQLAVDKLQAKQMSEPVQLLEGVAILRLDDRKVAQQRDFEAVKERAASLWQREEGEQRWKRLIAELRKATPVRIDESHYQPQRGGPERPRSS
jgi:parvulin-like peptidyl-prolyl isomerase